MKAVLDTNVFISFLLGSDPQSPPVRTVLAGLGGNYTIVYSQHLLTELERRITTKPYLASRIPQETLDTLTEALRTQAEAVVIRPGVVPPISRDRKDDFLLIDAAMAGASYLVSGDHDLLDLGQFERVRIVSPAEFVTILDRLN